MLRSRIHRPHRSVRPRRLAVESLEARRLLASAGYQNPDKPLDVDHDQFIVSRDTLPLVVRLNSGLNPQLTPLPPGEVPQFYYDTDDNGFVTANDLLLVVAKLNSPASPPVLTAGLANDTSGGPTPDNDKITRDPSIAGQVLNKNEIVFLTAIIDSLAPETSIKHLLQPDGSFTLKHGALDEMLGAPLADGPYVVHVNAVNERGFPKTVSVAFTLDRFIAPTGTPDLVASSDTGISNSDNLTKITTPQITVAAEPGSLVTLFVDGVPRSVQATASGATFTLSALADGPHQMFAQAVDGAGNATGPSNSLQIEVRTTVPEVALVAVPPFQDDLTPVIQAAIGSAVPVADGELILLDIDRNNDGDYNDPDEPATASSLIFDGKAAILVTVPLADPGPLNLQPIKIRVRVSDDAGNEGSDEASQNVNHGASNALKEYVEKVDGFYEFTELEEILPRQTGYRAYTLLMTSQKWRVDAEVDRTLWQHWMTIVVPDVVSSDTALLNIRGEELTGDKPQFAPPELWLPAVLTGSIVVDLPQVPLARLKFAGDDYPDPLGRLANAIIAYSFDEFLKDTIDTEWPALVAMVKAAVKGMDTVETLVDNDEFETLPDDFAIDGFVLSGGGPWAWTAWLTAAVDERVAGLIPSQFESINQDQQNLHHYGTYGFFSEALKEYADEDLFERALTAEGALLASIVDPYRYLDNGNFEIPKYLIQAVGDEFYVPDAAQHYYDDLPGTQNYLYYFPNTGHVPFLPFDAFFSSIAYYDAILHDKPLPEFSWDVGVDGSIQLTTIDTPAEVRLWQATNPTDRDFRFNETGIIWSSLLLTAQAGGGYVADLPTPTDGATAFYIELVYPSTLALNPGADPILFRFTTQVSVKTSLPLYDWPYPAEPSPAPPVNAAIQPPVSLIADETLELLALALAMVNDADSRNTWSSQ